jgi:glycosyltransferase involved in cell wall biosynthesis
VIFVEEHSSDMSHKLNKLFIEKLNRADCITFISNFTKEQTHNYFKVPKVPEVVIYNGNPVKEIINRALIEPHFISKRPFFFSIGDFIERKNFHSLIEMMRIIPDYDFTFTLVEFKSNILITFLFPPPKINPELLKFSIIQTIPF